MVQIPITEIFIVMMALARAGALFYFVPVYSARSIPRTAKIGMLVLFAVALVPIIVKTATIPATIVGLVIAMLGEIMVGTMMGLTTRLVFYAVGFGSDMLSQSASLMRATAFDPTADNQQTVLAPLFNYLAVIAFCVTGTHLEVYAAFVRSYDLIPVGLGVFGFGSVSEFVRATSKIFVVGLSMSAPLIAFAFVVNILIAILGRVASKFNILVLSFSFRILGGIIVIYFSVKLILGYIMNYMDGTGMRILYLLSQ